MSRITESEFERLLQTVAASWERQDVEAALACFTSDAEYVEPPDIQLFRGEPELRRYFGAVEPGTTMRWWRIWFDEASQTGAGEYTFASAGASEADHGVAVIELEDGRISRWSEYQRRGPADRERFLAVDDKAFLWHSGNYP